MGRAPCCEKVGLKKGRWTKEEDEALAKYIKEHGEGSWRSLPKNAGLLRCGKSCRLRWINYLRADLKRGNISEEEEEMIIKLHATLGNRWSLIAGHLPGRTDNEIKNYWNSHLSRRATDLGDGVVVDIDLSKLPGGGKRRGGRTSRGIVAAASNAVKEKKAPKGKEKKGSKDKEKPAKTKAAEAEQQELKEAADTAVVSPARSQSQSQCQSQTPTPSEEHSQSQASASGVTSEEDPLALSEEMMSELLGPGSPMMELGLDGGSCRDSDGGGGPAAGDVAHDTGDNDKAIMDWDLMGQLDISTVDDMWDSLVWDCDDVVLREAGHHQQQQQELDHLMSDLFFLDNL
ncbi:hypothetical protein BS78_03G133300 [Paspalum vaginatum]|nr:hypothetical protein BS78_03G133300 [Paspalum vaginatum]